MWKWPGEGEAIYGDETQCAHSGTRPALSAERAPAVQKEMCIRDRCRGVRVKTGRYNQHVSDAAVAVEMGHNQNTLQEVLNSVPYLAKAMATAVSYTHLSWIFPSLTSRRRAR